MIAKVIGFTCIKVYKKVDGNRWDNLMESKRSIVTFNGEWDLAELIRVEPLTFKTHDMD